jgi:hypothetical protein
MKNLFLPLLIFTISNVSFATGGDHSGGGDYQCEARIKSVISDIKDWINSSEYAINQGGYKNLELPAPLTHEEYYKKMLTQIEKAEPSCVGPGDPGYPVTVEGVPKTCRFDLSPAQSKITCDWQKFNHTDEAGQYPQIHHELAGLAEIERPQGSKSNYDISDQLVGFLEDTTIKKLVIFPTKKLNCKLYFFKGLSSELDPYTGEYGDITEDEKNQIIQDSLREKGFIFVDSSEKSSLTLEYRHSYHTDCDRHYCTFYNFKSHIKIRETKTEINWVNYSGISEREYLGIKEPSLKESLLFSLAKINSCGDTIKKLEKLP